MFESIINASIGGREIRLAIATTIVATRATKKANQAAAKRGLKRKPGKMKEIEIMGADRIYQEDIPSKEMRDLLRLCQRGFGTEKIKVDSDSTILVLPTPVNNCVGMQLKKIIQQVFPKTKLIVNGEYCTGDCSKCAVPDILTGKIARALAA